MSISPPAADRIFAEALLRAAGPERAAYLNEACGEHAQLQERVERLLRAHDDALSFLETPPAAIARGADPTINQPPAERPGTQIGPYKLLQQIGEGGMGIVWMAEQHEPVRRKVALKVIRPGMDSGQVIARFEAERQALSLMDHPNIAKVLDAGTTASGRPYFVMELVKGQPITQYCDEKHLTPRQRLELLLPVCQAIQHAHQKGIIHRDIKPTNILVAEYDQEPVPKVIDFGVAKATSQALTEKTMFTGLGQIVGTLEYMSPEQAKVNQLDIDTRSDIYSLGVLLYELLTGSTPFDKQRLRSAAFDEMLRIIREEEPPKPSTRLSDSQDSLPSISAQRHTDPAKLTKLVRGELDWIVMKALEKDRNRRYETASGFAADVQRYLNDEQVQACPPSAVYRLRKFARRNKGGLSVAALVLFFLVLLGSGIGWTVRDRSAREAEIAQERANREAELTREREARTAKVAGQVESIFADVDRLEKEQKWPEALAAARRAGAVVAGGETDSETAERVHQRLKDLEFIDRLEQIRMEDNKNPTDTASDQDRDNAKLDRDYALAFRDYGVDIEELSVEASIERLKARPALAIPLAAALDGWVFLRRPDQAAHKEIAGWERLVAVARGIDPEPLRDRLRSAWGRPIAETQDDLRRLAETIDIWAQHPETLYCLARTLQQAQLRDSALRMLRKAYYVHPGDYHLNLALAFALKAQKDREGAIRFFTAAVSLRPQVSGFYWNIAFPLRELGRRDEVAIVERKVDELESNKVGLGSRLQEGGKPDEAIGVYRQAIEAVPKNAVGYTVLANALRARGKPDEAIAVYRQAMEAIPEEAGKHWREIGDTLRDQKKPAEAADAYRKAIDAHRHLIESRPERAVDLLFAIGDILRDQGKPGEANAVYREAIDGVPKNAVGYGLLGNALSDRGKLDEAIDAYRKAVEATSDLKKYGYCLTGLAAALSKQQRFPEAIDTYHKLIENYPKNASAYFNLGTALRALGRLDEAIDAYSKAIELDPKSQFAAGAYHNLGIAFIEQKNLPAAILAYRRAIELDPEHLAAGAFINLGGILQDQGKPDEAIACFQKAIAINQPYATVAAYVQLGNVLSQQNKLDEAIVVYRKIIELKSDSPRTHNSLAWILANRPEANLRDPKQAVELAKKAVELKPEAGAYWNTLGVAHYRAGDWKGAITALEKSMELSQGGNSNDWFFLAMTHWQLGEKDKAREWYDKAVQWMEANAKENEELIRFRAEAEELMKKESGFRNQESEGKATAPDD